MKADWTDVRLGDLVSVKHGWPFKSEYFSEELTGRPIVVNIGNFQYSGGFRFDRTTLKEYRGHFPDEYTLKPGEILVVMTCQTSGGEILGVPGRIPNDGRRYLHNQRMGRIEIKHSARIDADFLYYLFLSGGFNRHLFTTASGTKILHTSPSRIESFCFRLPSISEQQAISKILRSLDDKIELNRRMNETLEAMARTLFKSWFVDFDPVRAKAEGRKPLGMDAETAALFPDSFQDSPLGRIPKGSRAGTVSEDFDLTMGQSPPGTTYNEQGEGSPFFQGRADFGFRYPSERVYCTAPTRFANPGDTLISVRAPVGDMNMALLKCAIGRGVASARHKMGGRSFTYYALWSLRDKFARFEAEGTVFGSISKEGFASIAWVIRPVGLVKKFEQLVSPMDQAIEKNENESKTLAATRDALLPKLVSGEIRVKDTEKTTRVMF